MGRSLANRLCGTLRDRDIRRFHLTVIGVCWLAFGTAVAAEPKLDKLVHVTGPSGARTSLLAKVVVVSSKATLSPTPEDRGEPIEPWAIFFRVRNADGTTDTVNGKVRVGNSEGRAIGWLGVNEVRNWNTRFILDPIDPQPGRAFAFKGSDQKLNRQNAAPEGKRRYALITETPKEDKGDDTEYPVVIYAGNVQAVGSEGTLAKERNELSNVKLEIMFVIESTDFMKVKWDDRPLLDYLKDFVKDVIGSIHQTPSLEGAVRLGFAEYQDNVPAAKFTSRLTCNLTDDYNGFVRKLDTVEATQLDDDWPDDVLAGVYEAVQNASWSANSVKHVILIGAASCQLTKRGENPPQLGLSGSNALLRSNTRPRGYNSTDLTIDRLISLARPQAGDSKARQTKTLHAMLLGKQLPDLPPDVTQGLEKLLSSDDDTISAVLDRLSAKYGKEKAVDFLKLCVMYQLIKHQRELGLSQYRQIAQNNGEADGVFLAVEPAAKSIRQAADTLAKKLKDSFHVLAKLRGGEDLPAQRQNEISQPLFTLVGAAAEKFKDSPALEGTATVRDEQGHEVAFKKVLVSEMELRRLRSTFDAMYSKFKGRSSKADRQDVTAVLNDLQQVLAETGAGQQLEAEVKLKDLISDLPLRTAALDTSAADIALMTSDAFRQWLSRLEAAKLRIDDLLTSRHDWLALSEKAVNDKFTFLRLSELP